MAVARAAPPFGSAIRACLIVVAPSIKPTFTTNKLAVTRAPGDVLRRGIKPFGKLPAGGTLSSDGAAFVAHFQVIADHHNSFSLHPRRRSHTNNHIVSSMLPGSEDNLDPMIPLTRLKWSIPIEYHNNAMWRMPIPLIEKA